MDILAEARRRAFSLWLRTGRLPGWLKPARAEFKFNPWHDPDDGRFTFAGTGRYFAPGRSGTGSRNTAAHSDKRRPRSASDGGGHSGGGNGPSGGGWGEKPRPFGGFGGGESLGGGATERWDGPEPKAGAKPGVRTTAKTRTARPTSGQTPAANPQATRPPKSSASPAARQPAATAPDAAGGPVRRAVDDERTWQQVERNGYTYSIDTLGRTRRVTGMLTETDTPRRSRTTQAQAGKPDRRASDDGGHYIAARFNGPTDAFNHFAQNARFNRGAYRALEDTWARATRANKSVRVDIAPVYGSASRRPSFVVVTYWIDGQRSRKVFSN